MRSQLWSRYVHYRLIHLLSTLIRTEFGHNMGCEVRLGKLADGMTGDQKWPVLTLSFLITYSMTEEHPPLNAQLVLATPATPILGIESQIHCELSCRMIVIDIPANVMALLPRPVVLW